MRAKIADRHEACRTMGNPADGPDGCFDIIGPTTEKLFIVASWGTEPLAQGWEHVSVSTRRRCPNWIEMCFVKDIFWPPDECVIQYHVPEIHHINNHPHTLHLWRHVDQSIPMPPMELVGIKGLELGVAKEVMHHENRRRKVQGNQPLGPVAIAAAMALSNVQALPKPVTKKED